MEGREFKSWLWNTNWPKFNKYEQQPSRKSHYSKQPSKMLSQFIPNSFDTDNVSFHTLLQEQSEIADFISTSILETPTMIAISTTPTPNFEIYPATPLNETPGNQSALSGDVNFVVNENVQQQTHLRPRQTHRARSSSISSLSSIASSVSSFEETWEVEPENPLINMSMVDAGICMDDFTLSSPHSALGSPNAGSPSLSVPYFPSQDGFFLSQSRYLSADTQLSRSSSLSSNSSGGNCLGSTADTFISDDEGLQELLTSQLLACRRASMCNIGTSFVDPSFCTQDELAKIQHGHGRSYSLSTLDFQPIDDSAQCRSYEQAELLTPTAQQHLNLDFSQEMIPTPYDGSLQLSQEELAFLTFNSDLRNLSDSALSEQSNGNRNTQSSPSNRSHTEYTCTISGCSKSFRRKHSLLSHQRTHSDDKPFPCEYCSRPFARKHDMLRHRRMHTGQKPYLCEACGAGFYRTDARQRHYQAEAHCWSVVMKGQTGGQ